MIICSILKSNTLISFIFIYLRSIYIIKVSYKLLYKFLISEESVQYILINGQYQFYKLKLPFINMDNKQFLTYIWVFVISFLYKVSS